MNVIIAGDFAPSEKISKYIKEKKYAEIFSKDLQQIIASADYSLANLECPVIKRTYKPIDKCGPNLGCGPEAVEAITYAGFSGVTLANNHIFDYGKEGLFETVKCCREAGLDVVGVGKNLKYAEKILILEKDTKKLAIINCCEHEFSIATETDAGANPLNLVRQFYAIQEAKQKADHVLVIVHGGHEHYPLPSTRMQETYRFFVDAGADAVVNHHQHCFSGYEIYREKPIFYGLGNFLFDKISKMPETWYYGFMVELDFSEDRIAYKLYPYEQCKNYIGVRLLHNRHEFDKRIIELNNIIVDSRKLKSAENEYYAATVQSFKTMYQPYENRILNKLYRMNLLPNIVSKQKYLKIYNYLNCEAQRDKQLVALKTIIEK